MYLANDVIQNSKKKGPEYGKEFMNALPKAFAHIGETCKTEKLFGSLGRILNIWEERGVYEAKVIDDYRARLNAKKGSDHITSNASTTNDAEERRESKRKHEDGKHKSKKTRHSPSHHEEKSSSNVLEHNGDGDESPYVPLGEPPEPEDLIKALMSIENSASSDAVVRERIANLPPEISEVSCLSKLEDKEAAQNLAKQVSCYMHMYIFFDNISLPHSINVNKFLLCRSMRQLNF